MALIHLVALMPFWHRWSFMNDEAYVVLGAQRWLRGELPYLDWETRHPWGTHAITAVWFCIFGQRQFGTRSLMCLVAILQGFAIFSWSRRLKGLLRWFPWACWVLIGMNDFPILSYHWIALLFFCLASLRARTWVLDPSPKTAALFGVSVSLSVWCLQSEGLAACMLLVGIWLCWRPAYGQFALAGLFFSSLLLWLPFVGLAPLIFEQNFIDVAHHVGCNRFPYTLTQLLPTFEAARLSSPTGDPLGWTFIWTHLAAYTLKYGLFLPVLGLASLRAWRQRSDREFGVLVMALICTTASQWSRQTLHYQSYILPLWFAALGWEVSYWRFPKFWAGSVFGLLLGHWILLASLWQRDVRFPIVTPAGTYWTEEIQEAHAHLILGTWASRYIGPGKQALCFEYLPSLYTLWDLRNPLAQPVMMPMFYTPEAQAKAAQQLKTGPPEWSIYVPVTAQGLTSDYTIDPVAYTVEQKKLYQLLTEDYLVVKEAGGMQLLRHRASFPPQRNEP